MRGAAFESAIKSMACSSKIRGCFSLARRSVFGLQAQPITSCTRSSHSQEVWCKMLWFKTKLGGAMATVRQKVSGWGYVALTGAGLLISIVLLMVFVGWISIPPNVWDRVYYILLVPLGLAVASFTFGAMKSYARFTGRSTTGVLEAGGPFVAAALVVIGGFVLVDTPPPTSFSVTVRLEDAKGNPAADGLLTIFYGNSSVTQPVAANGEANFKDIPAQHMGNRTKVRLNSSKYILTNPDETYVLSGQPLVVSTNLEPDVKRGREARMEVERIRGSIHAYFQKHGRYPVGLSELTGEFDISQPLSALDAAKLKYELNDEFGYVLRFAGADGILGTADDRKHTSSLSD